MTLLDHHQPTSLDRSAGTTGPPVDQDAAASAAPGDQETRGFLPLGGMAPIPNIRLLALGALALVLAHLGVQLIHYRVTSIHWLVRDLLHLDVEQALATWYAAMLLGLSGLASLACARRDASSPILRRAWRFLGFGMLCMSVDEVAGLHEAVNTATNGGWAFPAGAVSLVLGLLFSPFLARLDLRTRTLLMYSGLAFLAGAVGVELATAHVTTNKDSLAYGLMTALEEGLELGGVLLYLYVLLEYLSDGSREHRGVAVR